MSASMEKNSVVISERNFDNNLPHGARKFYDLPTDEEREATRDGKTCNPRLLLPYIEESVIGKEKIFSGPFGQRSVLYCDYTASGRSLSFIEDYIRKEVLPEYGNTHTTTTVTSLQTTLFRHEARDIVRNAVHASEHDAVIFTGNGCTGAVHKLINALNLTTPPVVFVGPYEHHSNLLPWKEIGADVIRMSTMENGLVDMDCLSTELKRWQSSGRELIGCFSAASNVTGILADVHAITVCLHQHGALAFWDYATAGPYVEIDMNPVVASKDQPYAYKDAVYLSPHKFVGGVATPGILIAKKKLFRNAVPSGGGGGSIFFVRRDCHRYLQEVEMREEGGTPAIVESIRAGLVFNLKEAVTPEVILERDHSVCRNVVERWKDCSNLLILGPTSVPRLPIFSFLIKHPDSGLFLHHNFICAILNDLFGIQARGGCACAGPYALDLLGIDEELAEKIESLLVEDGRLDRTHLRRYREYSDREILRPGFARLNFPFFMCDEDVDFVIEAVKMVAENGWKLLPQYLFNPETGEWRHRKHQVFKDRKWLNHISYTTGEMSYQEPVPNIKGPLPDSTEDCLANAREIFNRASKMKVELSDQALLFGDVAAEIRWFLLPSEAQPWISQPKQAKQTRAHPLPFHPGRHVQHIPHIVKSENRRSCVGCDKVVVSPGGQAEGDNVADKQTAQNIVVDNEAVVLSTDPSETQTESPPCVNDVGETFKDGLCDYLTGGFVGSAEGDLDLGMASAVVDVKGNHGDSGLSRLTGITTAASNCDMLDASSENNQTKLRDSGGDNHTNNITDSASRSNDLTSDRANSDPGSVESFLLSVVEKVSLTQTASEETVSRDNLPNKSNKVHMDSNRTGVGEMSPSTACLTCVPKKASAATAGQEVNKSLVKWHPPSKVIFNPTLEALEEYKMITNGDKVLVCLSGGKDSLSLLHSLRQYQFCAKKKSVVFQLGAVTVDPGTSSYDPSPLKGYLKALNVPYFYEEQGILEQAANLPYECASICSFCSRMKRGRIYAAARREGYNVLAMGQHLDDLAESFLMNSFHNGGLRTMKANYAVKEGDLRVIRPFVYVREKDLRQFAEEKKLPVIAENCPACFEAPKERHRMKQLLAAQELLFPKIFSSLMSAMKPLMVLDRTGLSTHENAEANEDDVDL